MINELIQNIDYDTLYDEVDSDPTADVDVNTDGTISFWTDEGTELRMDPATLQVTELRDGAELGSYSLQEQLGILAAFAADTAIGTSNGDITFASDGTFTVVDDENGIYGKYDPRLNMIQGYSESTFVTPIDGMLLPLEWDMLVEVIEEVQYYTDFQIRPDATIVVEASMQGKPVIFRINPVTFVTKGYDPKSKEELFDYSFVEFVQSVAADFPGIKAYSMDDMFTSVVYFDQDGNLVKSNIDGTDALVYNPSTMEVTNMNLADGTEISAARAFEFGEVFEVMG